MRNNLLFLIRLRSHWRRGAPNRGFAAPRQAGRRAFRLNIQWCESPQFEVEIAHGAFGSQHLEEFFSGVHRIAGRPGSG
jgi:hypothetical protein